jgi:hypothetical protein
MISPFSTMTTAPPPVGYTVGIRIQCKSDPRLHVTMAYVGECDDRRLQELTHFLKVCSQHAASFRLTDRDMFGPPEKCDIPVWKCQFTTPASAVLWKTFYEIYSRLSPGMPEPKPLFQNYHTTLKNPEVAEELGQTGEIHGTSVFLKQLGQRDPVCNFVLPPFVT